MTTVKATFVSPQRTAEDLGAEPSQHTDASRVPQRHAQHGVGRSGGHGLAQDGFQTGVSTATSWEKNQDVLSGHRAALATGKTERPIASASYMAALCGRLDPESAPPLRPLREGDSIVLMGEGLPGPGTTACLALEKNGARHELSIWRTDYDDVPPEFGFTIEINGRAAQTTHSQAQSRVPNGPLEGERYCFQSTTARVQTGDRVSVRNTQTGERFELQIEQ